MELIEYQKRVFRAVPGGKNGTLSGHISARRQALAMRVMWSLDNYQPRIMLQFEARELLATLKKPLSAGESSVTHARKSL